MKKLIVEFYNIPNKLKTVEKNLLKMKSEKQKMEKCRSGHNGTVSKTDCE